MNVAGLPINVQRRIALLLDQDTAAWATPSTSFSLPDPPVGDQAAPAIPYRCRPEAGNHDNVQTWNLPVHVLASQLHQQPTVVVKRAALGPSNLQARTDLTAATSMLSSSYAECLLRSAPSPVYRLADQRLSMCYETQAPLAWEGDCSCSLITICRCVHILHI